MVAIQKWFQAEFKNDIVSPWPFNRKLPISQRLHTFRCCGGVQDCSVLLSASLQNFLILEFFREILM